MSEAGTEDGDLVEAPGKVAVPRDVAEAVRTLIRWAGDDPDREGLRDTPARVARAWREYAQRLCRGSRPSSQPHLRGGRRL